MKPTISSRHTNDSEKSLNITKIIYQCISHKVINISLIKCQSFQDVANSNADSKDSETRLINGLSQGDRLNQLKASRTHARSATTGRVQ